MLDRLIEAAGRVPQPVRQRWYATAGAAAALLVAYGAANEVQAARWLGLVAAITANTWAAINAHNGRRWLYGIASAAGSVAVAYGLLVDAELALWLEVASAVLGLAGTQTATLHTNVIDTTASVEHLDRLINEVDARRLTRTDNGPRAEDGEQP